MDIILYGMDIAIYKSEKNVLFQSRIQLMYSVMILNHYNASQRL